jgi:hypothetical protein
VTCSISSTTVLRRTGTSKPFDGEVDDCNDQYGRYEFFYAHCLMYVVRKEVYNNELIERMMTSRKVEVWLLVITPPSPSYAFPSNIERNTSRYRRSRERILDWTPM